MSSLSIDVPVRVTGDKWLALLNFIYGSLIDDVLFIKYNILNRSCDNSFDFKYNIYVHVVTHYLRYLY